MATIKPRFSVTFTDDCFSKILQYQKENNISTQSKAVARLVELAIGEFEVDSSAKKEAPLYSSEAKKLARDYDGLDEFGKKAVRAVADVEKIRCMEQAKVKLYIAARDGSRIEAEVDDDAILPESDTELPE